jgi:LytR cell envelope-related transcriptional attenuator
MVVLIALVVGAGWWAFGSSPATSGGPPVLPSGQTVPPGAKARLLTLDVVGGSAPYLAVMGTDAQGSRPAAIPIPHDLTLVVPGQGETKASDVAKLLGPSVQVGLSNELGVWTQTYVVMTVQQLGGVVSRMGGLEVNLPAAVATPDGVLGPGDTTLSGVQTEALLKVKAGDPDDRWNALLTGLMAAPPTLERADVQAVNSLGAAQRTLSATQAGEVLPIPIETVAGSTFVAQQPETDHLVQSTWNTRAPIPAIVQNGNGAADVSEAVARKILPAGFRVVISENAQSFDVPKTSVISNGVAHAAEARRAQKALGIGQVQISSLSSNVGDITVVVGKDFTG